MKKTTLTLLLATITFLAIAQCAYAGDILSVKRAANEDGYIGLYIENHIAAGMRTNPAEYTRNALTYFVDGVNTSIIENESASRIKVDETKLVVLDKKWPTTGYYNISITYRDESGVTYPDEYYLLFAVPGLSIKEVITEPKLPLSNTSLTVKLIMEADGEKSISGIDVDIIANPRYYTFSSQDVPRSMSLGSEEEFKFKFIGSSGAMSDTVIYTTVYLPIEVTYTYYDHTTSLTFNESILVYNYRKVDDIPDVETKLQVNSTIRRGTSANATVYAWNKNLEGHDACDLNFSLSADSSAIQIPIKHILPGEKMTRTSVQPEEPDTGFEIKTSSSVPLGKYELTLVTTYKDCEWKSEHKVTTKASFELVKEIETNVTPSDGNETPTDNVSITPEPINETPGPTDEEEEGSAFLFYLAMGGLIALIIAGVVYTLIRRSQYI